MSQVLSYITSEDLNEDLSLKLLSRKLVVLLGVGVGESMFGFESPHSAGKKIVGSRGHTESTGLAKQVRPGKDSSL